MSVFDDILFGRSPVPETPEQRADAERYYARVRGWQRAAAWIAMWSCLGIRYAMDCAGYPRI